MLWCVAMRCAIVACCVAARCQKLRCVVVISATVQWRASCSRIVLQCVGVGVCVVWRSVMHCVVAGCRAARKPKLIAATLEFQGSNSVAIFEVKLLIGRCLPRYVNLSCAHCVANLSSPRRVVLTTLTDVARPMSSATPRVQTPASQNNFML